MLDKTILITGFGPFNFNDVNASWEAVKLLDDLQFDGYKLIKREVPVTYEYIDGNIARLWKEHKPTLVIHVGVSAETSTLRIERLARRKHYNLADANGAKHPTGEVCSEEKGPIAHFPQINVPSIIDELNGDQLTFTDSTEAGLFLCEYIYYTSLNVDNSRVLFIHVPPLKTPYSAEQLAQGLAMITNAALKQLPNTNSNKV